MSAARRLTVLMLLTLPLAAAPGCSKKTHSLDSPAGLTARVSVQPPAASSSVQTNWASRIYPARFSETILPSFPPEAIEARVERASVRVDFVIGTDGLAHDVRAAIVEEVQHAAAFEAACLAVAERWRFSPSTLR